MRLGNVTALPAPSSMVKPLDLLGAMALAVMALSQSFAAPAANADHRTGERRLLYVAVPGIRDYLEYGGHGVLVFDIDHSHRFVKRLPSAGVDEKGHALNVKGICASSRTGRLYVSTTRT